MENHVTLFFVSETSKNTLQRDFPSLFKRFWRFLTRTSAGKQIRRSHFPAVVWVTNFPPNFDISPQEDDLFGSQNHPENLPRFLS